MKTLLSFLILFMVSYTFQSCSFDTSGELIKSYRSPQKALLVMDVQADFTGKDAKMPVDPDMGASMIKNVNHLIEKARQQKVNVIYIQNVFSKDDFIANWFRNQAAIENTDGVEFDDRLVMVNDVIFQKNEPDAFSNSKFEAYLITNQINELYLCGVFADQCVFWTSKGALNRGYQVHYVRDAVAAKSVSDVEKAVSELKSSGVLIKETDDLF